MKNVKSLLLLLLVSLILVSCDSDEPSAGVTIDGKSFNVISASLLGVSIGGDGHATISLTSANSSMSKTLSLDFEYSPNSPIEGNYSFPQVGSDRYLDDWLTNYSEITLSGGGSINSTNLETGKITIQDNGNNNYTVTMDLTMIDGTIIKGKYRGAFLVTFNNS
ncbi:MAG TPA: hypothetical protein VGK39_04765 [Cyclobacteriaceae bacterium]